MMGIDGDQFVSTMSQEAVSFYSDVFMFMADQGTLRPFQSQEWGTKIHSRSEPKNAVKCAAQKGKCECHVDSFVYYGLKGEDGRLDTS